MPTYSLKKLGAIIKLEYGRPLSDEKRDTLGKWPVYGANGEKDRTNEFYYDKPSIIVGRKGSAGELNLTEEKFWPLDVTYFITFDSSKYNLKFLYYLLTTLNLPSLAKGVKPGINRNEVYSIEVIDPPLSVQEEIVAKLDSALASIDEAKTKTEQSLAATRELWESTLEEAFRGGDGWKEKRLEEVCDRIMDGTHFSPKNSTTGERLYVSAKNIKLHGVDLTKATYISEEDHKIIYKRCPVKKGDVLYIKDGATTGIATINNLDEEFSLLSSVAVFQVTKKLLLEQFLVYYLNSGFGKKHMLGMIDGTAITRLTLTKLNSGIIPLAPLSEQSRIVAHLDDVRAETDRLASLYEQKLADLDELRRSVLQEAFA